MTRPTVDYGIDLGTTNSAVAVLRGTAAEVIKNNEHSETTPSAVWINKEGMVFVGSRAKARYELDKGNVDIEFKRRMGSLGHTKTFVDSGRNLEPEDLSAEVLKSLRASVRQRTFEDIDAAVITVPATFGTDQIEATQRAAQRAGLTFTPLVQEPTAAAYAYGFQTIDEKRFWLVYDFGGGTFDSAIVHLDDGQFHTLSHEGDAHLGGTDIDWAIVEKILAPEVQRRWPLRDFRRGVPGWLGAFAQLKKAAEEAKISLSSDETAFIDIHHLCTDDEGRMVDFDFQLARAEVERLAMPFYERTLSISKQTLRRQGLAPGDVEKMLLVGGPTLAPLLREMLTSELGIRLDISQDPMTVVARGAAIFAGTQHPPKQPRSAPPAGQFHIELVYKPMGSNTDPPVGGQVISDGAALPRGMTVQFENPGTRPAWSSGSVPVGDDGRFMTTVFAEEGRRNTYEIALTDSSGRPLEFTADELVYTIGAVEDTPVVPRTLGIGLADNQTLVLIKKGTALPAEGSTRVMTTHEVQPGSGSGLIRIPVVEGEHPRADRNKKVGVLEVKPAEVDQLVPVESRIDFDVTMDESRRVHARAYVEVLDRWIEETINLRTESVPDTGELRRQAREARERHRELIDKVQQTEVDPAARERLDQIDREGVVVDVDGLITDGPADADAAASGAERVTSLHVALDDVEGLVRWPQLVRSSEEALDMLAKAIAMSGTREDRETLATCKASIRAAIEAKDVELLQQRNEELVHLLFDVLDRAGLLQVQLFTFYQDNRAEMTDQALADRLFRDGRQAIEGRQMDILRSVNHQLQLLLPSPPDEQEIFSTVLQDLP